MIDIKQDAISIRQQQEPHPEPPSQVDKAAIYIQNNQHKYPPDITEEDESKIIRKLDFILIPILFFTSTMGAVDKVSLSTAAIYGFVEDTNLKGQQFSWLGSILFIGSLCGMIPMSYILSKYPLGKVLAVSSLLWSGFTLLLCTCQNFTELAILRFLMGFFECVIVPGCTLIVGRFYQKQEQGIRLSFILAFASSVINGFLSWLVGYFNSSIPAWKLLYLLVGGISFLWSLLMIYYLPDSPMNCKFLNDREKFYITKRVLINKTGVEINDFKWGQIKESFLDVKTYMIFFFNIGINIPNGGLSTFTTIIINNLGFNPMHSSLMTIPTGVIATIATIFFNWLCTKLDNRRCCVACASLLVPIIGSSILYGCDRSSIAPQLVGLYLLYFYFAPYVILISLAQANSAGNTKKSTVYSINYTGYCIGALIGPQTFRANQSPTYTGGFIAMLVSFCFCIVMTGSYCLTCKYENRKKERELKQNNNEDEKNEYFYDLTDKQQKYFRYTT
ncbi:allantoate permease [Scheffersomyces coipomensis]|uniref:allantoate permease n=1 Tax=Scheffersomyces coipomensis TaxID=1788519 RepID=UPI00315DFC83